MLGAHGNISDCSRYQLINCHADELPYRNYKVAATFSQPCSEIVCKMVTVLLQPCCNFVLSLEEGSQNLGFEIVYTWPQGCHDIDTGILHHLLTTLWQPHNRDLNMSLLASHPNTLPLGYTVHIINNKGLSLCTTVMLC